MKTKNIIINQLIWLAREVYNITPYRIRRNVSRFRYYYQLFCQLRLNYWIATGHEINSGMPFSILCACNARYRTHRGWDGIRNINYLCELAFGTSFKEHFHGRTWLWKLPRLMKRIEADYSLVIVQVHKENRKFLKSQNWFFIPNWVFGEINLPLDEIVTKNSSVKSDLRRIRKHSLNYEVTRNNGRLKDFYYNMYVPYISKVHERNANIVTYDEIMAESQNLDLLLVGKNGKFIAGILIIYEEKEPRLWVIGIRDGNLEYVKDGAVGALYHFSLRYLEDNGFEKVKSGYSRPFLSNGILQYKKKLSQKIIGVSLHHFALQVKTYSAEAKAFLQNNPFIFESQGSPHGAIFVEKTKELIPAYFEKIDKQYFHDGLSKLFIYSFDRDFQAKQDSIPPSFAERIVVTSAADMG